MQKLKAFSLFLIFMVLSIAIVAAADKEKEIPPWMENVEIHGRRSTYLVPKGAKRKTIGSQVIVENPSEYTARRLYEVENDLGARMQKIEESAKELKGELEELKMIEGELESLKGVVSDLEELKGIVGELDGLKQAVEELKKVKDSKEDEGVQ